MKITRRISAIVLSVVMILSMMPVMAFAEDDNAAAGTAAADEIAVEEAAEDAAENMKRRFLKRKQWILKKRQTMKRSMMSRTWALAKILSEQA